MRLRIGKKAVLRARLSRTREVAPTGVFVARQAHGRRFPLRRILVRRGRRTYIELTTHRFGWITPIGDPAI